MSNEPVREKTNFTSKLQYEEFVNEVITLAKHEVRIFEQQLGTSYNASARHEAFRQFLLASRRNKVRIVVHDAATIDRFCPRMKLLLRTFNHAVTIHETQTQAKGVYDPFVIADEMHSVRRFHFDDLRGLFAKNDPIEASTLVERFEEIWEVSIPAVTVNTLGL
ncbi:MAG: hypothetical protein GTO41_05765 [Burkholderiales bacterium]|nr:hypothetical protein [Burkholderiales bacterium]